jgi:hypothetical protein
MPEGEQHARFVGASSAATGEHHADAAFVFRPECRAIGRQFCEARTFGGDLGLDAGVQVGRSISVEVLTQKL